MFISFLTLLFSEKFFGHITLAMISPLSFLVYVFIHDIYFDFLLYDFEYNIFFDIFR